MSHIDGHLLGIIQGQVPPEWMAARGWVVCPHCDKSASASRMGGVHDSCAARARATQNRNEPNEWGNLDDGWEAGGWASRLRKLPVFADIFKALVYTREFTHRGLLTAYRQEFGRLCANVVRYNRMDAWDFLVGYGGEADTVEMKRCRVAWTEWAMLQERL